MRHLSMLALAVLEAGGEEDADLQATEYRLACTAAPFGTVSINDVICRPAVTSFLDNLKVVTPPDCPRCAVLWDQALEEYAQQTQKALDKAAWLKADEDNNEAFWETIKHEHGGVPYKRSDR